MNNFKGIGRLTKDVETRYTNGGMAVARFTIALDRGKDKDGNDKGADFPSCVAFGRNAENLEKFSGKGLRVAIDGRIQTGSYDGQDGKKVYTTDVVADRIEFIDWKQNGSQNASQGFAESIPSGFSTLDEDIPF